MDANQAGNARYNPALQVQQTVVVSKADQIVTFGVLLDRTTAGGP